MGKKGYLMTLTLYFFVIQCFIIGAIWGDSRFYRLGLINLIAWLLILIGMIIFSSSRNRENQVKESYPIVKERIAQEKIVEGKAKGVVEEIIAEKSVVRKIKNDEPISESNIEYMKTKINRTKRKPLSEGSGLYRFLVFLLSLLGFGGILYIFWDSLDFIAALIGAIAMLIFIGICFKSTNIWKKSLFSSIYFWVFLLLLLGNILCLALPNNQTVNTLKDNISTFFDGIKGENIVIDDQEESISDFFFETTGAVTDFSLSGEEQYFSGEEIQSGGIELDLSEGTGMNLVSQEETIEENTEESELTEDMDQDPKAQVKMIDAIKHLVSEYNIPLSTSTSQKFIYVAKSNEYYPYMKTAQEKRMIGTDTDPNMIISCDVYMVMKGLAANWNISKTVDVKTAYWTVAASKGVLNGCVKGAKLTYANL